MQTIRTLEEWQTNAERHLPKVQEVTARNRAITATYAELYLKEPRLFKWAGMATFASHRVGLSLIPFTLDTWVNERPTFLPLSKKIKKALSLDDDLNLMRLTNNAVFHSIAWAHRAFLELGDNGREVVRMCAARPGWGLLADGFALIGEASRRLKEGEPEAAVQDLIWRGNLALLRFEQAVTVQRSFDKLQHTFTTFLTWALSMDFDGDELEIELDTFSYFPSYMWTRGFPVLLHTRNLPRVERFDHRFYWVERSLLPIWQRVDRTDRALKSKLSRLIDLAASDRAARRKTLRRAG